MLPRISLVIAVAITAVSLVSCATFEESGLPGSASSMAHNQMMHVSKDPETFGHYRLDSLARLHPDLGVFLQRRGMPDFLAETSNDGQDYYILYYLDDREAYASRTRPARGGSLEFAGPYPVTKGEYETLDAVRRGVDE